MQGPVHPHVKAAAALLKKWGMLKPGLACYLLLILSALLISAGYSVLLTNHINWVQFKGALLFTMVAGPIFIGILFYLVRHLDKTLFYLEDSARHERQLSESMQHTIRQLNFEIEERKKAFHAKYHAIEELRNEIAERKKAQGELEKAYYDKGKFIATLSHELRTPLNGIVGLTQRLLDSPLGHEQRSWANTIFSSAETLGNIFNDIIDLDKIDRQDLDIVYQSVSLTDFLNDIANFAELICQQKGLNFSFDITGDAQLYLRLDPTRLRQVLWNLLNNAVKFTADGMISLHCSVQTSPNVTLTFNVRDTGIGIAGAELERIFDLYYKSSDGRRLSIMGSGIGLSVSKALVEAMNGHISVSSEVGQGSEFCVTLPSELMAKVADTVVSCPELVILLVEDVPLNADIAISLLEQRGHTVLHAETGEDAIALLETEDDIDLVLLDMQLPDMTGDEIARYIRADIRLSHLPVVVLSANVRKAEEQLSGLKIDGALAKPLNTAALDNMLARLFSPSALKLQHRTAVSELPNNEQILDLATLEDYRQSLGKEVLNRSAALFQQLLPNYIQQLQQAFTEHDRQVFQDVAHKLKGAAASVGLLWVQQQTKKMEQGYWPEDEMELLAFHKKTEQHLAALSEFINNG